MFALENSGDMELLTSTFVAHASKARRRPIHSSTVSLTKVGESRSVVSDEREWARVRALPKECGD